MNEYHVGQAIENFIGHQEGASFDLSDGGATLIVFFSSPIADEIVQFKSGANFEIRFTCMENTIFFTFKIGSLAWMDAPYTPHLSKNLTQLDSMAPGQGLGLTLILVDTDNGEIKSIHLMGLSTRFTTELFKKVEDLRNKEFYKVLYDREITDIMQKYTTKQIANMSNVYCKIGGK